MSEPTLSEVLTAMRSVKGSGWSKMKDPHGFAMYLRTGDESLADPDDITEFEDRNEVVNP